MNQLFARWLFFPRIPTHLSGSGRQYLTNTLVRNVVGACLYVGREHLTVLFGFTGLIGLPWVSFDTSAIRKISRTAWIQVEVLFNLAEAKVLASSQVLSESNFAFQKCIGCVGFIDVFMLKIWTKNDRSPEKKWKLLPNQNDAKSVSILDTTDRVA